MQMKQAKEIGKTVGLKESGNNLAYIRTWTLLFKF